MKLHHLPFLILSLVFIFSCNGNRPNQVTAENQNQTPEVLDDAKIEVSSLTKREAPNMVQNLFNEAVSKDEQLKNLTDRINGIGKIKTDSLKSYREYFQNNEAYWSSANDYIGMIGDSALRNDLKEIFKDLESKYNAGISKQKALITKIDEKQNLLNDYEIIMKLSVTIPMINTYQKNKMPTLKTLNNVVVMYDTLINETKDYSTIKK
jgi:hypothetical protein